MSDSVRDVNGSFIADKTTKIEHWREHFKPFLNFDTEPNVSLLPSTTKPPRFLTHSVSCDPPSEAEVADTIKRLCNNKTPEEDAISAEI
ncbi:unnamed protein product [Dibothriocephalus latus]|uniref:Uncharacterized protein n=1 Tax=Dibothriocephalus latus TaxID=60516 RepID=A0A3P7NTH8_DIBLA|nr:unnamed protein product [Dibothriocephalus latus]